MMVRHPTRPIHFRVFLKVWAMAIYVMDALLAIVTITPLGTVGLESALQYIWVSLR